MHPNTFNITWDASPMPELARENNNYPNGGVTGKHEVLVLKQCHAIVCIC